MSRRRRSVEMRVNEAMLRQLLRLRGNERIIGARTEGTGEQATIVLAIDAPDAPVGALGMKPLFEHNGAPDPISLTAMVWRMRDGSEITESAPQASGMYVVESAGEHGGR